MCKPVGLDHLGNACSLHGSDWRNVGESTSLYPVAHFTYNDLRHCHYTSGQEHILPRSLFLTALNLPPPPALSIYMI